MGQLDAYESDLAWLRYGQEVEFSTEAYPGEVFKGRVAFIDPVLNEATRTVKVRVNVSNEDGRLKPEMFVRAIVRSKIASGGRVLDASLAGKWISPMHPEIVKDEPGNCDVCGMPLVRAETLGYVTAEPSDTAKPLVIPVSAALLTGTRAIVYVQVPTAEEPTYEGREIVLGPRAGDYYLVRSGLNEGELVVTNGNFKLDSALQISAKPSMMTPEGGGGGGGHHHGGEPMKGGDGETMSMSEHAGNVTSEAIGNATASDHRSNRANRRQPSSQRSWTRFAKLSLSLDNRSLRSIAGQLGGDMKMQWQEFAMLLAKRCCRRQARSKRCRMPIEVFLVTKRHTERVQEMFGLSHAGHEMAEQSLDVPAEFRAQLTQIIPAYLSIGEFVGELMTPSSASAGSRRSATSR